MAHFEEETERIEGVGAADEGGVVHRVLVSVGNLVEQFLRVEGERASSIEVEEGVKEEVGRGGEEAGNGGGSVELLAGTKGRGASASPEKRTEEERTVMLCDE